MDDYQSNAVLKNYKSKNYNSLGCRFFGLVLLNPDKFWAVVYVLLWTNSVSCQTSIVELFREKDRVDRVL